MPPTKNRHIYFEASPAAYATIDKNRTRFLLIHGKEDEPQDETISFSAQVAPRLLRFLKTAL